MSAAISPQSEMLRSALGGSRRPAATGEWAFRVIAEITNFEALRRQFGRARADSLSAEVGDRLTTIVSGTRLLAVSARQVEIAFTGTKEVELEGAIASFTRACAKAFGKDEETYGIRTIFGGAAALAENADDVMLSERAERALTHARRADEGLLVEQPPPDVLTRELPQAIKRNELVLHYQPKLNVRRQEIGSAEGLVRWAHPTRGLIPPGEFIPAAEQSDLIGQLTLWTIGRAIADQKKLKARGHDQRLFINISGNILSDSFFVREVCEMVSATDVQLGFEITETSVIRDPQSAIANLRAFADSGIVISIDDYGAGLSSLAYLKQLPARELKIDKLFVTDLTRSNRDPLIVRSTIDLAHALEMEVVAEGVETHAAMALLSVMGCDMVQGFLIGKPVDFDAFCRFLDEDRNGGSMNVADYLPPLIAKRAT